MNKWGVVALLSGLFLQAQSGFEPAVYTDRYGDLPYRILLPENSSTEQKYPLIVVLHGAGERGKDNRSQLKHGSDLFLQPEHRTKYPAIVVFPQCPKEHYWATILERSGPEKFVYAAKPRKSPLQKQLIGLIKKIKKTHAVDPNKIYVGGLSMGGMGTFELVYQRPRMFAAAFAICGGAHPKIAKKLRRPAWRIDHGEADEVVPFSLSKKMMEALTAHGATVDFYPYPLVNHNSWEKTFSDPGFLPWLFAQRKGK